MLVAPDVRAIDTWRDEYPYDGLLEREEYELSLIHS